MIFSKDIRLHLFGLGLALFICLLVYVIAKDGLGAGDIKLLISLGFALGIAVFMRLITIVSILSFIFGSFMLLAKKAEKNTHIPFAPFIALGFVITVAIEVINKHF